MNSRPVKALVVDDDGQIREMLRRLLTSAGIEVCAAMSSGEDAVAWMAVNDADVVIMDIQMPGIGGIEATRAIVHSNPAVIVFGFTGWGPEDTNAMLDAGASQVFAKTNLPDLLNAIKNLF